MRMLLSKSNISASFQVVLLDDTRRASTDRTVDAYVSFLFVAVCFALSVWFAPVMVDVIGPKYSILFGSVTYLSVMGIFPISFSSNSNFCRLYILSFYEPMSWLVYLASCQLGFGAATLWTGQMVYMAMYLPQNEGFNSTIFWVFMQLR